MKVSKYTKLLIYNDNYYVYNSLSNFLCKINKELYFLLNVKEEDIEINDEEIIDFLLKNKIITHNDNDDLLLYIASIEGVRRTPNLLNLTITPTMDCNFHCPYCFETKEKGIMDEKTIDNIIDFINNSKCDNVNITWFGGEPLLATEVIKLFHQKFKTLEKVKIKYQNIITNGYYLTDDNLKLLKECGINFIQLSMDGIFESHNKKRFTKTDKNTFSTILQNIDNFCAKEYGIHLGIRMNIDNENIEDYPRIHKFFKDRYINKNISISPAFIIDTTKGNNKTTISDENKQFDFKKVLVEQFNNSKYIYPSNDINECAIRNLNAWAIDARGDLYKCWEIIGNKDYKVGELTEKGIIITNKIMLNRYLYGSDPFLNQKCLDCFLLPICGGGCPHKRIENDFNNKNFDLCSYNENFEDYIIERIKIYEKGK